MLETRGVGVPVMNEEQYRRMRKLVKECCNYDNGQCIVLDRGDGCVCVQRISYSLICKWFMQAVLPLDQELEAALLHRLNEKRCVVCGRILYPGSNRAKYCPACSKRIRRRKEADRMRKARQNVRI